MLLAATIHNSGFITSSTLLRAPQKLMGTGIRCPDRCRLARNRLVGFTTVSSSDSGSSTFRFQGRRSVGLKCASTSNVHGKCSGLNWCYLRLW
jgi:hypothetical protein